ncbi:MAG: 4-hydroxybenzoyl-CoA thioesterase [Alteromonadaceae bacterium]|jgi:acyl-CoA thioester hydrolase|uniref:acyl-CoA thioesterase n=1 Tax=Paraglaciecola chathamensis TaxID=368405 RepID=UPI000C3651FD|nr:4-hydroxybenzoyl-CoA thioesterase [Alteromonadaceae bacterium]|tara:strand:+ start:27004 stop:27411 length:408 start_codon:yes stop_codon:yes gene_type:complete
MIEAETKIVVPFHDIDVMRIAWHGHYVKYLEIARCELLDKIEYNFPEMEASGYAWPVIDLHIRYASPLNFGQQVTVKSKIVEWENRLKIAYQIVDKDSGKRLTKATTTQVAVDIHSKEMLFESPHVLFEKLGIKP